MSLEGEMIQRCPNCGLDLPLERFRQTGRRERYRRKICRKCENIAKRMARGTFREEEEKDRRDPYEYRFTEQD